MKQIVRMYQLDERQNAKLEALAQEQRKAPETLVREAVAEYISATAQAVDEEVAYRRRIAEITAKLNQADGNDRAPGSWRDAGIDGVQYQDALREK